jgi:S1-C subfamily serine protease
MKNKIALVIWAMLVVAFIAPLHATADATLDETVQQLTSSHSTKESALPPTRALKEAKAWEDICETSKNAVIQILTFAKSPNILEPFRSPERLRWRGSGFFIQPEGYEEGYILSNFHVVEEKELCFMQLPALSKERFLLEVVGSCPEKDFALLKLDEADCSTIKKLLKVDRLPCLSLGNSDALVEGETIMALGYPLGMENFKSSKGIVSGRESTRIGECIQTTAAINHGNSGGPVVDKTGKVVGISTMGPSKSETEGIAFLVPINSVKLYLGHLQEGKLIRIPFWDIEFKPTTVYQLTRLQAPTDGGVYVKKVFKASLFEQADVQAGDILYQINGVTIDRFGNLDAPWGTDKIKLLDYLNRLPIGSTATITTYRNGTRKESAVTVKERTPFNIERCYPTYETLPPYEIIGGLVVSELSLNHLKEFLHRFHNNIDPSDEAAATFVRYSELDKRHESRLIISSVLPDSPSDKTRCFDETLDRIISKVNGNLVTTIQEFRDAVRKSVGKESLTIRTEGGTTIELAVADIVAEEEVLRQRNEFYPRSKLIDELEAALT